MPRHPLTYIALGWLGLLVLGANAGASIPDGLGMTVFFVTFASIVYLYVRMCRRWPIAGWLALGFFAGLFGWQRPVYVHTEVTVDDEGNEVTVYDDSCDAAHDTYCDSGGSSDHGKTEMSNALSKLLAARAKQPAPSGTTHNVVTSRVVNPAEAAVAAGCEHSVTTIPRSSTFT